MKILKNRFDELSSELVNVDPEVFKKVAKMLVIEQLLQLQECFDGKVC
jgi:hypothetical protein